MVNWQDIIICFLFLSNRPCLEKVPGGTKGRRGNTRRAKASPMGPWRRGASSLKPVQARSLSGMLWGFHLCDIFPAIRANEKDKTNFNKLTLPGIVMFWKSNQNYSCLIYQDLYFFWKLTTSVYLQWEVKFSIFY